MPSPPVVVEISASNASTAYAQVLVEACSDGLRGDGQCVLEGSVPSDAARAVAIVLWEGADRAAAKIEVGMRRTAHADWLTRHVTFDPSDAEVERWRSVGLIIATLLGSEAGVKEQPPSLPLSPAPTMPRAVSESPSPQRPGRSWFFEVGAELARGTGDVFAAAGGGARAGLTFSSTPFFATGSLRYELEPQASARVRLEWGWVALGLGLAAPLHGTPFVFEARCEPTLGGTRASATGGGSAAGALFGVREGAGMTWWWGRWIGLSLSADVLETTQSAVVNVSSGTGYVPATKAQWLQWSTGLGFRIRTN
jgi:hypothetical protein